MLGADGHLDGSALMFRTRAAALIGVAEDLNRQAKILMDVADLLEKDEE